METTFAALSFDIPAFKKSKGEAVQILREMQADIEKFNANTKALLVVDSRGALKQNRQEATEIATSINNLTQKYNGLNDSIREYVRLQIQSGRIPPPASPATTAPAQSSPVVSTDNLAAVNAEQQAAAQATGLAVSQLEQEEAAAIVTANEWAASQTAAAEAVTAGAEASAQAAGATGGLAAANEAVGVSATEAAGAYAGFSTELQASIAAFVENDVALKSNRSEQAALQRTIRQSGAATAEQTARLVVLTEEEILLKQTNRDLNTTIQATIREQTTAAGSTDQLRARVALLTQQYRQLSAAEQQAAGGQAIQSELNLASGALRTAEQAAGRAAGAVNVLSKGFGFLRTAANIIPGLGISGIFLAAFEGAKALYEYLVKDKNAISDFAAKYKVLNDVIAEGNKNADKLLADAKILYETATDPTASIETRRAAIRGLKEEFPDLFAKLKDEAILNGNAKKDYDNLTESIVKNAQARAAVGKIAELESQRLDIDFQKQKIYNAAGNEIFAEKQKPLTKTLKAGTSSTYELSDEQQLYNIRVIQSRKLKALDEQDKKEAAINDQEKFLKTFIGEKSITKAVVDAADKRNKATADKAEENINKLKQLQRQAEIDALKTDAAFQESIAGSEAFGEQQRIISERQASADRIKIIQLSAEKEIEQSQETLKKVLADKKASDSQKKEAEQIAQLEINQIIANGLREQESETASAAAKIAVIRKEYADKAKKETADAYAAFDAQAKKNNEDEYKDSEAAQKARLALRDDEIERQKYYGRQDALQIQINQATEEEALTKEYKKGKFSKEEYEKEKAKIQKKYAKEALEAAIKAAEAQLKLLPPGTEAYNKLAASIAQAKQQVTELADVSNTKLVDALETANKVLQTFSDQALNIYESFYQRRIQQIEHLDERQQASYDQERANIENSTEAQTDKDRQLKLLDAKRAAQKKQNDIAEAVAERKKAQFEKVLTISRIIVQTALDAAKAGFITPEAILIELLGAAQVVAVAAQPLPPLPQYRTGVKASPEGPAIVGEAGRELRIEPTGEMSLTPERAAYTYLQKNTEIVPAHQVENRLLRLPEIKLEKLRESAEPDMQGVLQRVINQKSLGILRISEDRDSRKSQMDKRTEDRLVYAFVQQTKALLKGMRDNRPEHPDAAINRERERQAYEKRKNERINWGDPNKPKK